MDEFGCAIRVGLSFAKFGNYTWIGKERFFSNGSLYRWRTDGFVAIETEFKELCAMSDGDAYK